MPDPRRPHPARATPAGPGRLRWEDDLDVRAGPLFPPTRRDRLRWTLLLVGAGLCTLVLSCLLLAYGHLNANLRSAPLFGGLSGDAGSERPDPFGREPINVLLIGSDTRAGTADCGLGGDCADGGAGANADVEMVVHVAADRSNVTVMSVPRDTMTDLPACATPTGTVVPAHHGQINSTLAHGPGCTVAAVHHLTGIPIDHFVMADFAGVIAMSDAVGGARICVSGNVYDNYSHLKLTQGTHTLTGLAALEFVRSRHAFGDGGDRGRTYAQHLFLSAVIRNLKSAGTLANPARLYALADAATKALTVDTALANIPDLIGLATDLDKVPPHRITFTTMETTPDPADPNRVVPAPAARRLFALITADQPLTAARTTGTGTGGAGTAGPPAAGSTTSTSKAPALTADTTGACAPVSTQATVTYNGTPMTPAQAFQRSTDVPLSAP